MSRPLAWEFVNSKHRSQWWSDSMTDHDMDLYREEFIMNNWLEYLAYVADKKVYGL